MGDDRLHLRPIFHKYEDSYEAGIHYPVEREQFL